MRHLNIVPGVAAFFGHRNYVVDAGTHGPAKRRPAPVVRIAHLAADSATQAIPGDQCLQRDAGIVLAAVLDSAMSVRVPDPFATLPFFRFCVTHLPLARLGAAARIVLDFSEPAVGHIVEDAEGLPADDAGVCLCCEQEIFGLLFHSPKIFGGLLPIQALLDGLVFPDLSAASALRGLALLCVVVVQKERAAAVRAAHLDHAAVVLIASYVFVAPAANDVRDLFKRGLPGLRRGCLAALAAVLRTAKAPPVRYARPLDQVVHLDLREAEGRRRFHYTVAGGVVGERLCGRVGPCQHRRSGRRGSAVWTDQSSAVRDVPAVTVKLAVARTAANAEGVAATGSNTTDEVER